MTGSLGYGADDDDDHFVDQIEKRYKKARSYTDKLTQSILAKVFRGELVPQDESDEPASVLLERIKNKRILLSRHGDSVLKTEQEPGRYLSRFPFRQEAATSHSFRRQAA